MDLLPWPRMWLIDWIDSKVGMVNKGMFPSESGPSKFLKRVSQVNPPICRLATLPFISPARVTASRPGLASEVSRSRSAGTRIFQRHNSTLSTQNRD